MKELEIAWGEITLREMSALAEGLNGVAEVDGDKKRITIRYEGAEE